MKIKNILLFLSLIFLCLNSISQQYLDINFPGRASVTPVTPLVSLYACESTPTAYKVEIDNISPFKLANLSFSFKLPAGINYQGGFIGPTGSLVSFSSPDSVVVNLDTLKSQQVITLQINIVAECGVYQHVISGGTFEVFMDAEFTQVSNSLVKSNKYKFSPIVVNYPIIQLTENSYNPPGFVNYNLTNPSVGDMVDREIRITNGGTSRLDSVYFTAIYSSSLQVVGYPSIISSYPPAFLSGTDRIQNITLSGLDFSTTGNGDNFLDPGETFVFRQRVLILNCNNTVSYFSAAWGCETTICQNETVENRIIFPASSPRLSATPSIDTNNCYGVPPTAGQRMGLQLFNYATNPVDSAQNIFVDIFQNNNGFSPNFYSVIDTSTIRVRKAGGGAIPFRIISTSANNPALCNGAGSNSVGRFIIQIDKIYHNELIDIDWRVFTCVNTTCTNGNLSIFDWGYNIAYDNRCDYTYRITNGVGMNDKDMRHHLATGSAPIQVFSGSGLTTFKFDIVNSHFGFPKDPSSDYLSYTIEKPACMDFSGLASDIRIQRADSTFLSPSSLIVSGNTINIRFASGFYNLNQAKLILKLTPNCLSCTPGSSDEIKINSFYSPSSCSVSDYFLGCVTSPLSIICITGCHYLSYGTGSGQSYFERTEKSFGLADYDNDGLPDGGPTVKATANKVNKKIAAYGDVLKLNLSTNLTNVSPEDKFLSKSKYIYFYTNIHNGDLLNFDSLRIDYEYAISNNFIITTQDHQDTNVPYTITTSNIGLDSTQYLFKISIDTLRNRGYIPPVANHFLYNVSYSYFNFKAYYHVDSNPGLNIVPVGVNYTAFLDTANITSNSQVNLSKHNICFYMKDKIDVIGFDYNSHWNTYNTFNSCDTIQITERFRFNMGTWIFGNPATNYFKNEYRNFSYLDTLNINTGSAYNIIGAKMTYYRTDGTLSLNTVSNVDVLPLMTGAGNNFNFNFKSLFSDPFTTPTASKPFIFSDEGYMADLTLTIEPNCQNQGGLDTINYTWNVKTDSLEPKLKNCNTLPLATGSDRLEYIAPQPSLQPTIQLVRVKGKQVVWDVLVTNNSLSYAKNVWIGFNNIATTSITVNSVQRIASGSGNNMTNVFGPTDNPPHTYTSLGNIYRVKDLAGGKDIKFRITGTIDSTNCNIDSLVFTLGYSCDGYPTSLATASCPTRKISLFAQPMQPTLFNSISTAYDTIQLCDTALYTFVIENTNIGKAYNIKSTVYFQQYLNYVPGSAEVYDFGIGAWVPIAATIGFSGQYGFNVSQALSITLSDGLAGLGDTNNKIHIRFKATAECNYTSGSKIEIASSATSACGNTFESLPTFGTPLHIQGATPSHRNKVILTSDFLSPCLDSTDVNVKVVNLGPINSWTGDSVTIALPRGVKYAGGTYSPVSNATTSPPSILFYGGREYLSWSLNNLVAFTDTSEFNLKVYSLFDSIKSCEANYIYAYTTTQDSVVCSRTGTPCNVKVISGDTTEAVFTYKATLDLSNPIATSIPNPPSGERVSVSFDINNLGQAINTSVGGNVINTTISVYRDSDNSGTYSFGDAFVLNKSKSVFIPQGNSTYLDTFDLPAGDACDFIIVIDFDENSCVCNTSSIFFSTSTLIIDEPNDTVCENEPKLVGYQDSITGYTYTWTTGSTNANLSYLSSSSSAYPTFTAPSITNNIDSMIYFVEVDRLGCTAYDTLTIYIIKTPEANVRNDTTVCYDSVRLSGNTIVPSSSTIGTITTYWTIDSAFGNGFTGVTISNINDPNALVTGLYSGSYKFIWNVDNGICFPKTDTIQVDVINPVFDAGNDTILCNDTSFVLQGNITSPGFTSNWSILSTSPIGASISNSFIVNPTVSGLMPGVYNFQLELIGPGCNFYDTVEVTVLPPDTVYAGIDSSICAITTFNLWATPVAASNSGLWTVDSTQGNHTNITIINDTLFNTSATFASAGIYHLIWNSTHPICGMVSDTVVITITDPIFSDAGIDTNLCETFNLLLYANRPVNSQTGVWSQLSGPSTVIFSDSSLYNSSLSGLTYGNYQLIWTMKNGVCDSVNDTLAIFVDSLPTSYAGLDDTLCVSDTSFYLLGTTSSYRFGNSITWNQVSGNPVIISNPNSQSTAVSGLISGIYQFELSVSNGFCPPVLDTLELTVFDVSTSDAGMDDTICITNAIGYGLSATAVSAPHVGTWTQLSGAPTTITNANSETTTLTGLAVGVYEYVWNVTNGVCDTVKDTVEITVFDVSTSDAGMDDTICITNAAGYGLSATAVSAPHVGTWTQLSGAPTTITNINSEVTPLTGLSVGVYEYVWNVTNGVCDTVKDTVEITVFDVSTSDAGMDDTICITNAAGYALSATAFSAPHVGTWTQLSGAPTTITNINSEVTPLTGLSVGVYEYVWNVTNGVCDTVKDTVEITVFDVSTSDAGMDDTICITNAAGYGLSATAVSAPHVGIWTQLSGAPTTITNVNSETTTLTGLAVGVYEYVWNVTNGVCDTVKDTVEITVFDVSTSDAGMDDTICITNAAGYGLSATAVSAPHVGIWTQLSGAPTTITNINSEVTPLTGLSVGVYEYVWNVTNGVCDTVRDTVEITVFDVSTSDAGMDDTICITNAAGYGLSATAVSAPHVGTWTQLSGAPTTITNVNSETTTLTGLAVGVYEYVWNVTNGVCDTVRDTVEITVFDVSTSDAGMDDTICITNAIGYGLSATAVSAPHVGIWTQLSGAPTTITNINSEVTPLTGLSVGVYEYVWNVTNGVCDTVKDTVEITVFDVSTSDAGMDDTICITNAAGYGLSATAVSAPHVGTWTQLSGAPTTITNMNSEVTPLTGLSVGVYEYVWNVTNGVCDTVRDTVEITVFDVSTSDAGMDDTICITNAIGYGLSATAVSAPHVGIWTQLSGAPTTITNINSEVTPLTGLSVGVYEYVWNVTNGVCDTVKDTVEITVFDVSTSDAGMDDTICITNAAGYGLSATAVSAPHVGTWTQLSGAPTTITNVNSETTTLTGLAVGVYEYVWNVTNGVCDTVRDTVEITVFDVSTSDAGMDDTICMTNAAGYGLSATAVSAPHVGTWTQLSGAPTTITNVNSETTTLTGLAVGVYEYVWNVTNGVCDTVRDTVEITVFDVSTSDAGMDDTICITNAAGYGLSATAVSAPHVGTWTQLSGAPTTITNINSETTTLTGLSVGVYEYVWNVTNGVCDTVRDTVEITVFDVSTSDAGMDDTICITNAAGYGLSATAVSAPHVGTWTQLSGAPTTITNINSETTTLTGLSVGVYEYVWNVTNGVCDTVKDTVEITVFDVPVSVTGADTQTCSPVAISLSANTPRTNEIGTWSNAISNPSVATFTNVNATNPVIGNIVYGTYYFIWTVDNGVCAPVTDTLRLKIDSISKPFAGLDDTICNSPQYGLNADPVTGIDIGTWTQLSGSPAVIGNIHDPKSNLTGLSSGDYSFVWTVSNITCPSVSDTINLTVIEQSVADAGADQIICDTSLFTPLTSNYSHVQTYHQYLWGFDAANSTVTSLPVIVNPTSPITDVNNLDVGIYQFILGVRSGVHCPSSYDTVRIEVLAKPVVDFTIDKTGYCLGECTQFTNGTTISDPSGSSIDMMYWSFGDGSYSTLTDPVHCYDKIGSYDVKLIVTSNMGCTDSIVKPGFVQINPLPVAGFDIESNDIIPGSQVVFTDQSIGAQNFEYAFGDGITSFDQNPIHNYSFEGNYTVEQIVTNQFGCTDTAYRELTVAESTKAFIPSAFTPNNDGDNDIFIPVLRKVDLEKYSFKVFNRWGELLFETSDIAEGWDGTHKGVKVQSGVYVWTIVYKEENGFNVTKKTGHVSLLK